jgi:hypothetical protein
MATKSDNKKQWYMTTVAETCDAFDVQIKKGLTSEQVRERARQLKKTNEKNIIKIPKISAVFWATISIMLVLSASVFVLESNTAAFVFAFSACILGAFAFMQQGFVRHILLIIAKAPPVQVTVRRNGSTEQIAATNLVPGDILILNEGDFVPADLRILDVKDILIDESKSTGQAAPVSKNTFVLHKKTKSQSIKNMISAGSYIVSGTGIGLVVLLPETASKSVDLDPQRLNKKQQQRNIGVIIGVFVLGLSVITWGIPIVAAIALSALLAMSAHYYALFWLQYVTWASLYDQAVISGLRFRDFKALKSFSKIDMVFVSLPSDYADMAALIHQLQAELRIEVRPLIKTSDVSKLEKELNIQDSALTYADFMGASRAKKIKQLNDYQLLVGFDSVATAEAVSLVRQSGRHVAWIDDSVIPQPASSIADSYISLVPEPSAFVQSKSDILGGKQVTLRKVAAFFDTKVKFKNITAY